MFLYLKIEPKSTLLISYEHTYLASTAKIPILLTSFKETQVPTRVTKMLLTCYEDIGESLISKKNHINQKITLSWHY